MFNSGSVRQSYKKIQFCEEKVILVAIPFVEFCSLALACSSLPTRLLCPALLCILHLSFSLLVHVAQAPGCLLAKMTSAGSSDKK